jgi:hypothetical protein
MTHPFPDNKVQRPEEWQFCDSCRESFLFDLRGIFHRSDDCRLDKLDIRCHLCKLLLTLCRSDPAITCLKVTHIDLCVAGDEIDEMEDIGKATYPFELILHFLNIMKRLLKSLGTFPKFLIQSWLHNHFPSVQRQPVERIKSRFPISHIKVKVYGIHNEETVVERYLRVFVEHGIPYMINKLKYHVELMVH